jgi:hypothetical protein
MDNWTAEIEWTQVYESSEENTYVAMVPHGYLYRHVAEYSTDDGEVIRVNQSMVFVPRGDK